MYSINFTLTNVDFCLSLHYNGANSYFFVNGTEIYKFKAKDSEIVPSPLCLGNISKDWSTDNMKRTGFNRYVHDFCVDYNATSVDDVKNIHRYLMKKNNMIWYDMSKNNIYKSTYKKSLYLLKKYFILDPYFY